MSRHRTRNHTFVHTITAGGTVYILFFEQQSPQHYTVTCRNVALPPFGMRYEDGTWRVQGSVPHPQQFEELLNPRLHAESK